MNRRNFAVSLTALVTGITNPALCATSYPLRVDGDIRDLGGVDLGDDDLLALEQVSFATSTDWTVGVQQFSGPPLLLLLEEMGAGPGNVRLTGINGYSVEVSRRILTADAPIVANRINGMAFDRREKGPFWVMFPFDQAQYFRSESFIAACVWQLSQITVLKG